MLNKNNQLPVSEYVKAIVFGLQEKKGNDIVTLDFSNIKSAVTDYFVICHADSGTQVRALADSAEDEIFKLSGETPWHKEGQGNGEWIILDFVNVVVHVFQTSKREYYGVEEFWGDAKIDRIKELV